ncbi:MAG: enoyl-CoA hydratase/isomerase family protein [Myxococcales bacterium]|nr:enoyl-CoA hydratase/isomerase family protein [Myxococcales bacterium]
MEYRGEALSWRHSEVALEVELHRAPLNEIGTTTLRELEILARYVSEGAGGAAALIWWSSRPGFCAGADLRELHAGLVARRDRARSLLSSLPAGRGLADRALRRLGPALVRREVRAFLDRIHTVFDALDTAPLTTIAAVNGVTFGGGFELALTADLLVADKTARFCFPELRLGLVPGFGGIPRLSRDVGNGLVRDLLLSGRSVNASRAHELGLVSQLVPKGEALAAARRAAEQVGRFDPAVAAAAKRFAKPLPREALRREKEAFVELVGRPAVLAALERFVSDAGVRPYLPGERVA